MMVLRWTSQLNRRNRSSTSPIWGHYLSELRNIPFDLELVGAIPNLRPLTEEHVSSGADYEDGILCLNQRLMWVIIGRSEGFDGTDAERLDMCLSDTSTAIHWT